MLTIDDALSGFNVQEGDLKVLRTRIRELCAQWYETGLRTGRREALLDVTQRLATIPEMGRGEA